MHNPNVIRMSALALAGLLVAVGFAEGAKPVPVVQWSNGFPSGAHFNLNIHGKGENFACDPSSNGGSVFVPEYGAAQIDIVQNKRASLTNLTVRDACGTFDGDPALVQLPAGEYQVYARILAKPQKDAEDAARPVVFHPRLAEACNDSGTANFTDAVDCDESFLLGTGVVAGGGVFDLDSQELVRTPGKTKAIDVTALFQWTGYACDQAFDLDADGQITLADVPGDLTGDGLVDAADLAAYLSAHCTFLENEWVFNIADLVVYGWDYANNGAKLVQVRFYPVATTEFE